MAFENPGGPTIWDHLREDPDRYIYTAVRHGVDHALPPGIAAGIEDISKRTQWNQRAPADFALPTEIWREVVARRTRYAEVRAKLAAGEVREINDLITLNLDIRQFAQDVIERCEGPDLLRAFWKAIQGVTVLDPTCGSGAFLFAALNILEPLYEACLDRMEAFVADLERSTEAHAPKTFEDFKATLAKVAAHPNARYFTLKSIILNNLFGVDIMEEAVEICKLRLFLKLAAQVEPDPKHANLGIEPLPDIDFNIRAGNTLVGYVTYAAVQTALTSKLDLDGVAEQITRSAADLQLASDVFRARQMEGDGSVPMADKKRLRERLRNLEDQLNRQLASEYGVSTKDGAAYMRWLKSHEPFHWFIQFHGIIKNGGFGVILGNPPYISSANVRKLYTAREYATQQCPDIYGWIMERSASLVCGSGRFGMVVPLSLTFSGGFQSLRNLLLERFGTNWFSSFARIPAALFSAEVRVRNTIYLGSRRGRKKAYTTSTHRWFEEARPHLVQKLQYAEFTPELWDGLVPKLSHQKLLCAFERAKQELPSLERSRPARPNRHRLYFRKSAYNWVSFSLEPAPCYDANGKLMPSPDSGEISFESSRVRDLAHTLLNGKIGLLWWAMVGDDFHVTLSNFASIPFPVERASSLSDENVRTLRCTLETVMRENLVFKLNAGKRIGNYNLARCRNASHELDLFWIQALGLECAEEEIELAYVQLVKTDFGDIDLLDDGGT